MTAAPIERPVAIFLAIEMQVEPAGRFQQAVDRQVDVVRPAAGQCDKFVAGEPGNDVAGLQLTLAALGDGSQYQVTA